MLTGSILLGVFTLGWLTGSLPSILYAWRNRQLLRGQFEGMALRRSKKPQIDDLPNVVPNPWVGDRKDSSTDGTGRASFDLPSSTTRRSS